MRHRCPLILRGLPLLLAVTSAGAGQLEIPYQMLPGRSSDTAGGTSSAWSLSADGRYLVFLSDAPNLVAEQIDGNQADDVFLYDRVEGAVELVSRTAGSPVTAADRASEAPVISADGRLIAFVSTARDLVPEGDPGTLRDVFLYDRLSGITERVSRSAASAGLPGNGESTQPVISGDGRWIAFTSRAKDLVDRQADFNLGEDVFLYDRQSGRTELVSGSTAGAARTGNGISTSPSISSDGRIVAFVSRAGDLMAGQGPGPLIGGQPAQNVFVFDRLSGTSVLASHGSDSPVLPADQESYTPLVSSNGEVVVYFSYARNLVAGQTDGRENSGGDVFLFHRASGATTLVNRSRLSASQTADGGALFGKYAVSADGAFVAFTSSAGDLVQGAEYFGGRDHAYLFERSSGRVTLVSHSTASALVPADFGAVVAGLSADGGKVVFVSSAGNLVDSPGDLGWPQVFLYDRRSGVITGARSARFSLSEEMDRLVFSADGNWVAFTSGTADLVEPGRRDLNNSLDVHLYGWAGETSELVSRCDPGLPSKTPQASSLANGMSADGRFVVFASEASASDLLPGVSDSNEGIDVFLWDRVRKRTRLLSRSAADPLRTADGNSFAPVISADGRFIVFLSEAPDVVTGQSGADVALGLFLHDRAKDTTTLVSRGLTPGFPFGEVLEAVLNADGFVIAFVSRGLDPIPGLRGELGDEQVFTYERTTGKFALVSHIYSSETVVANGISRGVSISADGRTVAFFSQANNLSRRIRGLRDREFGLYLYDRKSRTVALAGRAGSVSVPRLPPVLSPDGRFVAFASEAPGLVPRQADDDFSNDLFLYDRTTGTTRLVSHAPGSATRAAGNTSGSAAFSADGRFLAFVSAGILVPGQEAGFATGVFLYDWVRETVELVGAAKGPELFDVWKPFGMSPDGRYIAYLDSPDERIGPRARPLQDVYLYDRQTRQTTLVSTAGDTPGNDSSTGPIFVSRGGHVLFASSASNLVPGDFNYRPWPADPLLDVFLYSPVP